MSKNIEDTKYFAEKYFDFLITDFGFEKVPEYYVSYEYHFAYRKNEIEINFACEADGTSLPWVTLRNFNKTTKIGNKEQPEYYHLTEIETTEDIKKIYESRSDRYFPLNSKSDYEERGRKELELLLKENAEIIKKNPQILSGDLTVFPMRKTKKDVSIQSFISIEQPNGKVKTYHGYDNSRKGLFHWIKSFFK